MSGPQTPTARRIIEGREWWEWLPNSYQMSRVPVAEHLEAIEREAAQSVVDITGVDAIIAAFLASPEAAEELARALPAVARSLWARSEAGDHHQVWFDEDVSRHFEEYADSTAAAILAAWQQERAKQPLRFDAEGTVMP